VGEREQTLSGADPRRDAARTATKEIAVHVDDGVRLRARSRGSGRALVLCHGGPGLWDNVDDLAELLGDLFTVCTYDQRGCGRSGGRQGPYTAARFVADLDAVRDASGSERTVVGGHSWGAVLALLYAAAHPERVEGVIYVSGVGIEWSKWRSRFRDEVQKRLASPKFSEVAQQANPLVTRWAVDFANPELGLARAHEMVASGFQVNTDCNAALNAELSSIPDEDWQRLCARVTAPVLVVQGEGDPRPLEAVGSMVQALSSVERVILPGAGHYPWVERPREVRRAVETWTSALLS
jgi:proline iminopeptidase